MISANHNPHYDNGKAVWPRWLLDDSGTEISALAAGQLRLLNRKKAERSVSRLGGSLC